MKRGLLARLRSNGFAYIVAALILLLAIPLYQILVLNPTGFAEAQSNAGTERYIAYLVWIGAHPFPFMLSRALLLLAFLLLFTAPYSLYRIIVAQEIMYQQELADDTADQEDDDIRQPEENESEQKPATQDTDASAGLPDHAWRGKSFVVLAIWLSLIGIVIYIVGLVASTGYLEILVSSNSGGAQAQVTTYLPLFSIIMNTLGTGLLGMGTLFFGAMIARTGKNLWPTTWVLYSYAGIFTGAILCISAVAVLSAPGSAQSTLTTFATLIFAIWILWLGIMLVRLKAEI